MECELLHRQWHPFGFDGFIDVSKLLGFALVKLLQCEINYSPLQLSVSYKPVFKLIGKRLELSWDTGCVEFGFI